MKTLDVMKRLRSNMNASVSALTLPEAEAGGIAAVSLTENTRCVR